MQILCSYLRFLDIQQKGPSSTGPFSQVLGLL